MKQVSQSHRGPKVYLEIVEKIRQMIREEGLLPGDKIPSERELSELLNAGRSSVREALRALELLGLIETRRGEGTFLRDFRDHQLIKLLGMFILQDSKVKNDVINTKKLIEKDIIRLAAGMADKQELSGLRARLRSDVHWAESCFFGELAKLSGNFLLERIWFVLEGYSEEAENSKGKLASEELISILDAILGGNEQQAIELYEQYTNHR